VSDARYRAEPLVQLEQPHKINVHKGRQARIGFGTAGDSTVAPALSNIYSRHGVTLHALHCVFEHY
jgi:hypothetical protein